MSANLTTSEPMAESVADAQSQALANAPHLSARGLTLLLAFMCLVPVVTIIALFNYLPPVYEGKLDASVSAEGLPPGKFYETYYSERPDVPHGILIVHNDGDQDWTHLNIQVNKHYQIYEHRPIPAGESRRFRTDRFVSRTGAKFDLRYNPLRYVRIYARRPEGDRATFATDYPWEEVQ